MRLLACQLPACLPVPCLAGCWLRGGGFEGEAPHRASERTGIGRASQPGFPPCLPADLCTSSGAFFLPLFILRKSTTTTIPLPEWRKRERERRGAVFIASHIWLNLALLFLLLSTRRTTGLRWAARQAAGQKYVHVRGTHNDLVLRWKCGRGAQSTTVNSHDAT